jgi:hypothetical protein
MLNPQNAIAFPLRAAFSGDSLLGERVGQRQRVEEQWPANQVRRLSRPHIIRRFAGARHSSHSWDHRKPFYFDAG